MSEHSLSCAQAGEVSFPAKKGSIRKPTSKQGDKRVLSQCERIETAPDIRYAGLRAREIEGAQECNPR